ncbi:MAG: hypothetical protein M1817_001462 [Caeruleum heppii]|nr:MAG: hypothetical protein M1817_001462 [Caeruleum heppii]
MATIDIITIGFINIFPDQGAGGYPGSNFGNACGGGYYTAPDGTQTQLLGNCREIAADIKACQASGKKVLLSLGGASPRTYSVKSDTSGVKFADFLWASFGPPSAGKPGGARPFDDAVVDGFDFDIEYNGNVGYGAMAARLRQLYATDLSKKYYISAAPQCPLPDKQLGQPILDAVFDFIWIQFYNTGGCSARDFIAKTGRMSYDDWITFITAATSKSKDAKVYIGLPGSIYAVPGGPQYYLNPDEVNQLVSYFIKTHPNRFGGLMIWEATAADNNKIEGKSFIDWCKAILVKNAPAVVPVFVVVHPTTLEQFFVHTAPVKLILFDSPVIHLLFVNPSAIKLLQHRV